MIKAFISGISWLDENEEEIHDNENLPVSSYIQIYDESVAEDMDEFTDTVEAMLIDAYGRKESAIPLSWVWELIDERSVN